MGGIRSVQTISALAVLSTLILAAFTAPADERSLQTARADSETAATDFQINMLFSNSLPGSPYWTLSRELEPVYDHDDVAVFAVSSTGEASYEYWYNWTSPHEHENYSYHLSLAAVQEAYYAYAQEGFSSLSDTYNDFGSASNSRNHLTRVTVQNSQSAKSVDFWGNSALGIIPTSYADTMNLLAALMSNSSTPLNLSLNIFASNVSLTRTQLNVSITNNEDFPLYGMWSDGGGYRMYPVSEDGCGIDPVPIAVTLAFINYTIPAHATYNMSSRTIDWSTLPRGILIIMVEVSLRGDEDPVASWPMVLEFLFVRLEIEQGPDYTPSSPFAWIQWNSSTTSSGTYISVDASKSADMLDNQSELQVRWDWSGDLEWDTDWSTNKTASHLYAHGGNYTVKLQVRNSEGLIGEDSIVVSVESKDSTSLMWLGVVAVIAAVAMATAAYVILLRRKPPAK
jgi:PKD domain